LPPGPKKAIAGLRAGIHGGINPAELKKLGIDPDKVLDFSVCTNPFMPPPGIREKMSRMPIERYPDSQATELRERLSARLGIPAENILAGNGTTELIRLIALAYFRRGDGVMILEPTYGEYEVAGRIAGTRLIKYRAGEINNFTPIMGEVIELLRRHRPRAVFICNPNNPTGKYLPRRDIERVAADLRDGLLILDEAYVAFAGDAWDSLDLTGRSNVVVLRSMTKDYGLPGLRLGYAIARREIIDSLCRVLPPWNVNAIAQGAGTAVLEQEEYLKESLRKVQEAKNFLAGELSRLGFKVLPSDVHYFLVKVGNAGQWQGNLLKKGFLIRDCTSFGLKEYIRVSPRTLPECKKFIDALESVLREKGGAA
jgi:histidinol-phosphate aminotransferase